MIVSNRNSLFFILVIIIVLPNVVLAVMAIEEGRIWDFLAPGWDGIPLFVFAPIFVLPFSVVSAIVYLCLMRLGPKSVKPYCIRRVLWGFFSGMIGALPFPLIVILMGWRLSLLLICVIVGGIIGAISQIFFEWGSIKVSRN